MSSEVCRCGLATNVLWKAVPGSGTCIREGPLAKLAVYWQMIEDRNELLSPQSVQCLRHTMGTFCCEWHKSLLKV